MKSRLFKKTPTHKLYLLLTDLFLCSSPRMSLAARCTNFFANRMFVSVDESIGIIGRLFKSSLQSFYGSRAWEGRINDMTWMGSWLSRNSSSCSVRLSFNTVASRTGTRFGKFFLIEGVSLVVGIVRYHPLPMCRATSYFFLSAVRKEKELVQNLHLGILCKLVMAIVSMSLINRSPDNLRKYSRWVLCSWVCIWWL